ncbi:MAG TPA: coproporphyrinogen III oxidase family protein, partial [Thermoanaerobaculia bacterium]|nr:coproporphyrinogen III oxidase family protein [Thermoanaerobaculia bacterium]
SFDEDDLAFLGRGHSPEQGADAARTALAAGFPWVSLDLIYGLPGQSEEAWQRNLETAAALGPHHLSCYQLTIHDGTPFGFRAARGELAEMPEPAQARLFSLTRKSLSRLGFPAYEVSNFARAPELRSRHNRKYWDHTPYLGLGLGAHSFAWDARGPRRWWNERKIRPWTAKVAAAQRPLAGEETLDIAALRLEALLLGLRTAEGIDLDRFRERYGLDLAAANEALLARLTAEDLAERAGSRLRLTPRGLAVADGLAARFTVA